MSNRGYAYSSSGYPSTQQWHNGISQSQPYSPSSPSSYHSTSPVSPQGGIFSQDPYNHHPNRPQYPVHNSSSQPSYPRDPSYSYASTGQPGQQNPYNAPQQIASHSQLYPQYEPRHAPSSQLQSNGYAQYAPEQYNEDGDPYGDRPFQCDLCSLSFNRGHDLKRHRETHRGDKPFSCNGGCGKTFTRKDALKRHQIVKACGTFDGDN